MPMNAEWAMMGLVLVPLATAVVAFAAAGRSAAAWSVGAAAVQLGLVVSLTRAVLAGGPLRYRLGGWEAPLGIQLHADGLSALMLVMTAMVGAASTVYAVGYFSVSRRDRAESSNNRAERTFWPLWLTLWSALNALFLSGDLFNLYVTLELLTFSAVALIGLAGRATALVAAMRYLLASLVGSMFYLLGVALLYSAYGTVDWALLGDRVQAGPVTSCAAVLMIAGLLVKTALFPLHFWLPDAHANAPAPVSGMLSGLVLKGSFFIILRLWFYVFTPVMTPNAGQVLSGLGGAAILWGSIQAIRERRVKRLIAYSTVAQVGYLFLLFALAGGGASMQAWRGTAYFVFVHGCAKAAAFMVAGSLMHSVAGDELDRWRGIGRREPMLIFTFGLAGVSLMGLPPSGGFIAKWLLLNAAVSGGHWAIALVILAGGLLASVYVFRVVAVALSASTSPPATDPLPGVMRWPPLVLAVVVIIGGIVTTEPIRLLEVGSPFVSTVEAGP
jgi:multicomponent Na+:H+ antiporter subunit D